MSIISPSLAQLSASESQTIEALHTKVLFHRGRLDLADAYYKGEMAVRSLGIAIPPQLSHLRTVIGWPGVVVDALDERLDVEGFRYGGATGSAADMDLWQDIWQPNNLDEESSLGNLDALVFGRSFVSVGAPDAVGDPPVIAVESPRHMAADFDPRTRQITAAFRLFGTFRQRFGTLYLPNQTIAVQQAPGGWIVTDRDEHNLGQVPVVQLTNRSRTADRDGVSEITSAVASITDAACRTALGMEVAREFFAAPQRYILGASEDAFMNADGTPKNAWETYLGRVLALEGTDNGSGGVQLPSVGTFATGDPATFTAVLDAYATILASITGLPSDYLGIQTTLPASADAIRMGTDRLIQKVRRKQRAFGGAWENVMRLALLIQQGEIPPEAQSLETIWRNPEIPTVLSTTQAIGQQVSSGIVPPTSDVVLEKLGYSAVEIVQLAADREKDAGDQFLAQLANSLEGTDARVDATIATDLGAPIPGGAATLPVKPPV